jgi:nucleoid DNA-binding protein
MNRCILHVGMHKTGTTSIQESLTGFSDDHFAYYGDHRRRANHGAVVNELMGMEDRKTAVGDPQRTRRHFRAAVRALSGRTLILSGERIGRHRGPALKELAAYLRAQGMKRIEVAAYVRAPASYITSFIPQKIKDGSLTHFDDSAIARAYVNYRERFEVFDKVFGRENVHLWKFDPATFEGGDVVLDFCKRFGIAFPPDKVVRVNESLSREAIALLYTYRKHGAIFEAASGAQDRRLAERLRSLGRMKFQLAPELLRPVIERNAEDIAWIERRLGQSLSEPLGDERPDAIRSEADLLRHDGAIVDRLRNMADPDASHGMTGDTPVDIAEMVHALHGYPVMRRARRGNQDARAGGSAPPIDLIEELHNADLLEGMTPEHARDALEEVFARIKQPLATGEKTVVCPGFGRFRSVTRPAGANRARRKFIRFETFAGRSARP